MLDDCATALISQGQYNNDTDKSLQAVKNVRHILTSKGYSQAEIDDYLLERSYLSKTQIKNLRNSSIFEDSEELKIVPDIKLRIALHSDKTTTDLLIDAIQSKPLLLSCLQKNMRPDNIQRKFPQLKNVTLIANFYSEHKDIIDY